MSGPVLSTVVVAYRGSLITQNASMSRPVFIVYLLLVVALALSVASAPSDADANAEADAERRPFKVRVMRIPEDTDQDKARRKEQLMIMGPISMSKVVDFDPDGGKDGAGEAGDATRRQGGVSTSSWWNWLTAYHRCGAGESRNAMGACRDIWGQRTSNQDSAATPTSQ